MPHQPVRASRRPRLATAIAAVLTLTGGLLAPLGPATPGAAAATAVVVGKASRAETASGRDLVAAARAQLRDRVAAFGLTGVAGLRDLAVVRAPSGHAVVRFQQTVDGVPVLGGQLVAVLDRSRALVAVSGEVSQAASARTYDIAASVAQRTARRVTARRHGLDVAAVRSARPVRVMYDASLLDPGGRPGARAAWQVEVTARHGLDVRELVLVDAATGAVSLQVDQVARALERVVCDNAGLSTGDEVCRPGQYDRVEGQPATGIPDVDQAYDLTGATSEWFATRLGVDLTALIGSDQGDGRKIRSTTRYCGPEGCPLDNAFWTGEQMVYGAGFTSADDVVAHELTHGVTQAVTGLVYWFQSGAINESMSDVFGELVDLGNGVGTDTADVRWVLGEDLGVTTGGVARDMADPTVYGQPDHTGSDLYDFAPDYDDNGGVHTNSGVANKTAYLVADGTAAETGGAFNGQAFPGIGIDKTALVYWSALQLLTPGADFVDLAAALQQACTNLAATGTGGITAADCGSVAAASAATGLTRWAGPTAPRDVRMTAGNRTVRVSWAPPASTGASPLTSYAVWFRPAVDGEEFVALEPSSRSHTVDGLRPGVAYTVGLVAVTADGTSPSVAQGFSGAALSVTWPPSVAFGDPLTLRGVVAGPAAVPLPGRTVHLLRRYPGARDYSEVASATTAADGSFRLRSRPRKGASYVVTLAGRGSVPGDRTPAQTVKVRQRVTLSTDPTLRRVEVPRFRGAVVPARPGAAVELQRRGPDGSWRTVARARLDSRSRYDLSARGPAQGRSVWRVLVPRSRTTGLAPGGSREVAVVSGQGSGSG